MTIAMLLSNTVDLYKRHAEEAAAGAAGGTGGK